MRRVTTFLVVIALLSVLASAVVHAEEPTVYLTDAGWSDPAVGTWDAGTRTGVLTRDLTGPIEVLSDNVTLDGAGHTVSGSGAGNGLTLMGRCGVTVRNLNIRAFYYAAYVASSCDNTFSGNVVSSSTYGLLLLNSASNTITGNTFSGNRYGVLLSSADNNTMFSNNFVSNSTQALVTGGNGNAFNRPFPVGGNYWSNWAGPDSDGDGFVDIPYSFTGGQDELPLANPAAADDTLAPFTWISLWGTGGKNGWYVSDVQATLTAADNAGGSGVKLTEYSFDGVNWMTYSGPFAVSSEGQQTIHFRSIDNRGNLESAKQQVVKIDKTAPQITINTPADGATYSLNQTVIADLSSIDLVSGVAITSATAPSGAAIDTSSPGAKSFVVSAEDWAGNHSVAASKYSVDGGLTISLSVSGGNGAGAKLGSAVPVRFQLRDSSGNPITNATARIFVAKIIGEIVGPEMAGEPTGSNGGNLFKYDSASQQYVFSLSTKGLSAGQWRIRVAVDDGPSAQTMVMLR